MSTLKRRVLPLVTIIAAAASVTIAPPMVSASSAAEACPAAGHITYTLGKVANPTADQTDAYRRIASAMDRALGMYNCYTNLTKALNVSYNPSVATADANINGSIRFGAKSTMQQITAMHEISHTLGVGTSGAWSPRISGGIWTGSTATTQLRNLTGDAAAVLHGDRQHFWPYGLNYTSEVKSDADLVIHCKLVVALRKDMGL
jgi:hypothetical protein